MQQISFDSSERDSYFKRWTAPTVWESLRQPDCRFTSTLGNIWIPRTSCPPRTRCRTFPTSGRAGDCTPFRVSGISFGSLFGKLPAGAPFLRLPGNQTRIRFLPVAERRKRRDIGTSSGRQTSSAFCLPRLHRLRRFASAGSSGSHPQRRHCAGHIAAGILRLASPPLERYPRPDYSPPWVLGGGGQIAHTVLEAGKLVLESRTGLSGPFAMPFFAMDDGSATEESGDLLFGTLQWSGNWKIVVERNDNIDSVISGGINDFDFQWNLRPGAVFETPVFTFGFTEHGFGEMFRKIHRHIRTHIEPESTRGKVMPLICNTYGAFRSGEKMNAANTERAIQKAAALGAELFVFDAGWQETLGDWTAPPQQVPRHHPPPGGAGTPARHEIRRLGGAGIRRPGKFNLPQPPGVVHAVPRPVSAR